MTSLASSTLRLFSFAERVLLSSLLLLASCSTPGYDSSGETTRSERSLSGRFEWAVQYYESGEYEKAVRELAQLRVQGTALREFALIPFYLGMSRFRLGQPEAAAPELEGFLRSPGSRPEHQEARIALLLSYERLARWPSLSALAAETDKLTLFQYNRALLKLLWARALREQGELAGARALLDETPPYLDKTPDEERPLPFISEPDQDLWGRYHFTQLLVQEMECSRLVPKEIPQKGKGAAARRLYEPWLEAGTDCLQKNLRIAATELFAKDSPWIPAAEEQLGRSLSVFGSKIRSYLDQEKARLDRQRALEQQARSQLYRTLSLLDEQLKIFKNRSLGARSLESLRRQLDRLISALSQPSS